MQRLPGLACARREVRDSPWPGLRGPPGKPELRQRPDLRELEGLVEARSLDGSPHADAVASGLAQHHIEGVAARVAVSGAHRQLPSLPSISGHDLGTKARFKAGEGIALAGGPDGQIQPIALIRVDRLVNQTNADTVLSVCYELRVVGHGAANACSGE